MVLATTYQAAACAERSDGRDVSGGNPANRAACSG